MARVLLTGAGGFLGRYAVSALAQAGWTVVAAGRRAPAVPGAAATIACDLLDPDGAAALVAAARCDALVHMAWSDDPRARWHSADNLDWTAASLLLARRFADSGGKRMVFASSCAVYDFTARARHAEGDHTGPSTLYGAAKAATGALLTAAQSSLGLAIAEARVFFAYGAGEPPGRLVSDLASGIRAGRKVPCTDGRQRRDYLHAADIGRALALVLGSDHCGPVNVASGTAIPVSDLITEVARQMGRPDLPQPGALKRAADDPAEIAGDPSVLKTLGFKPLHDLRSGVAELLAAETVEVHR